RVLSLLTCVALLGLAPVLAQPADLPADARFDQLVSFSTGLAGEDLGSMLTALARAVDLTPIVDDVPLRTIVYDIGEPKPFRQVWSLVLTLNDLDYLLQPNDIVVLGTSGSLARLRTAAPEPVEPGEPRVQRFYRVNNDVDTVVRLLRLAVPDAAVEGLPGTAAVVVTATEEQHEAVAATLAEFDQPAEVLPLVQRTYFLSNSDADSLAETLRATGVIGGSTDGEEAGTLIDTFTVVADARTNSLIVTGTAAVQSRLGALIAELDEPQPQVNVQVRIQEITRRSALDLGIDWSTGLGNFTANILSGGLRFIFDTTQVISSLNVRAVLDALETQGLSRRVDDSNITVLNNGQGTIQSGGQIFITLPGSQENIERTIPYGVQVDVTPRITADGRITLEVSAKVEDVLSTTNDPTFLNLSTRNLTSTVTVEQGQTLLLGGLLQNSLAVTRQRLPIIGSIPVIGDLLGKTVTEEDDIDLLLIITATVID
ncbi:MAG TPA: secretin N-terminal domain-containing protein, partial [Thermoleophilia bacterium]|nr:secretin N-terminal domain-containing protein [Thermoleophilia bacterium]